MKTTTPVFQPRCFHKIPRRLINLCLGNSGNQNMEIFDISEALNKFRKLSNFDIRDCVKERNGRVRSRKAGNYFIFLFRQMKFIYFLCCWKYHNYGVIIAFWYWGWYSREPRKSKNSGGFLWTCLILNIIKRNIR